MPILVDLLKDEDWKVRTAAAKALAALGPAPKTAVLPLAKAATDHYGSVAQAAAMALAKMGPAAGEAVPVLAPEDLILLKLVAFRPKDTFDLETVIDATRELLDVDYLRGWADRLRLRDRLEAFLVDDRNE